jgi:ATP-binding cassette subfamily B protein
MLVSNKHYYDLNLKETVSKNRLLGLWRLMKGYQGLYIGAIILLAIATIARTGIALVVRRFVDDVIIAGNYGSTLTITILSFIGLALVQGIFTFLSGWLTSKSAENVTRRLRNFLFDHLQRLPYAYHAESQTGDLIARSTSDVDAINRFFS